VTLVVVVAIVGAGVFESFPPFGSPGMDRFADAPSAHYLRRALPETGSANAVTSVVLDYRGYDTLGEATILFASIVGALAVMRRRARRDAAAGPEKGAAA
jgi:multisubunit Na+/H+ antiporter MnhB subunit